MPTGQNFQMAEWLPPHRQFSSAAAASAKAEWTLHLRGSGEMQTQRKTSGRGHPCGRRGGGEPSSASVLSALGLSDSQHESKAEGTWTPQSRFRQMG